MKDFSDFAKSQLAKYVGLGLATFSSGAVLGYFAGKKRTKKVEIPIFVTESVETGVDETVFEQGALFKIDEKDGLIYTEPIITEITREEYEQVVVGYEDMPVYNHASMAKQMKDAQDLVVEEPAVNVVHIFRSSDDQWDYEAEVSQRSPKEPYVIHRDEYVSDEMGYEQTTVTYYSGDDIMTDVNDIPIYNHGSIIRPLKFGHGSGDPNVVYIRNDNLELEWEVLLHTGSYEIEVLGHQVERHYEKENLAHSNSVLKFRDW